MVAATPRDQYALALRNTAWRLTRDSRLAPFEDYDRLVRAYRLETPDGWPDLESFLEALRARLLELHDLKTHPLRQSLRGGTQVPSLDRSEDPLARAFVASARKAVARYIEDLGPGEDPIRARRSAAFDFAGGWSVRLRSEGFHADHVHPRGWISSAFYLDLPAVVDDGEALPQPVEPFLLNAAAAQVDELVAHRTVAVGRGAGRRTRDHDPASDQKNHDRQRHDQGHDGLALVEQEALPILDREPEGDKRQRCERHDPGHGVEANQRAGSSVQAPDVEPGGAEVGQLEGQGDEPHGEGNGGGHPVQFHA